ncbi:hypothetical protein JMA_27300 [Jeotgalibacillus malaysiensis]|uniref:Uncharacterized protein n=1 Tax=Jeotgalibacillus malaysiensis TaxID=1508404 RepID=A0A0B5ATJ6_9BACL|nr:hypothetical protein [Jeotgalibacillus malaysiensis]AJD92047.1 hypothetical protein JMA_27300 [Jeotgalibacillus malaysiensis]
MHCHDPAEQLFQLKDRLIAIDWGKNGDKSVKTVAQIGNDGTLTIVKVEELKKL